jgi:hypothetical protein
MGDELTSFSKILFFQSVVSHYVRVWRLILKNAKADFAMFGLQVYFFVKVFIGGCTFTPFYV